MEFIYYVTMLIYFLVFAFPIIIFIAMLSYLIYRIIKKIHEKHKIKSYVKQMNSLQEKENPLHYDMMKSNKMKVDDPLQHELDILNPDSNAWVYEDRDENDNLL